MEIKRETRETSRETQNERKSEDNKGNRRKNKRGRKQGCSKGIYKWTQKEKEDNVSDICRTCDYYGKCLTEHYRYVKDLINGCNGYKGLLDYARMEGKV